MQDRERIPERIRPMMEAYAGLLRSALGDAIYGVYLYGSLALDAYEEGKSDVDFLTVTTRPLQAQEVERLHGVHGWLEREFAEAVRMEGMYIPLGELGKKAGELTPYPFYANKRLTPRGQYDINDVTWWTLKHRGIAVDGVAGEELPFDVAWESVCQTMQHNVERYWPSRAERRFSFYLDEWIESAVLTNCRILYTLDQGGIISKTAAGTHGLATLPSRWHLLIREAMRIREGRHKASLYPSRMKRSREAKEFVQYIRQTCQTYW